MPRRSGIYAADVGSGIAQSIRPAKWVIVDDGSADRTPEILGDYQKQHDWIEVVTRSNRGYRAVGPGVIDAFYAGYEVIDPNDYDFLCKLDLDLRLPPRYFEILMDRMTANPQIATCSGKTYIEKDGRLIRERHGDDTSLGESKFYRISCFRAIGEFVEKLCGTESIAIAAACRAGSLAAGMSRTCALSI